MATLRRQTRNDLIEAASVRYRRSPKAKRSLILDQFVALTGYHRKHAVRVLNSGVVAPAPRPRARPTLYDEAVKQALVVLWEASDRICGKRLKPLIPALVSSLERHGHLALDRDVKARVLKISPSSIDRLLAPVRAGTSRRPRRPKTGVRSRVPIRTLGEWGDPAPGFLEVDLVSHCGGNASGRHVHTLVATDIASGWTECMPLVARDQSLVVEGLRRLTAMLPFQIRGIDSDNGTEFINETVQAFCKSADIEFTRARPYNKNDQAWVEQKNGSVVRRLVGYGRLEGMVAAETLARLYTSARLFVNFFQPSFKLISKERFGARVTKRYETPATPATRLLKDASLEDPVKTRMQAVMMGLDPLRLLEEIRAVQGHLAGLMARTHSAVMTKRNADLEEFLASLSVLWRSGEVRPTHEPKPRRKQTWRNRPDPFADEWPEVLLWLETEPDATAKELFIRLQDQNPGKFTDGQLRTLQRRVKGWRQQAALRLVLVDGQGSHYLRESGAFGNILGGNAGNISK